MLVPHSGNIVMGVYDSVDVSEDSAKYSALTVGRSNPFQIKHFI